MDYIGAVQGIPVCFDAKECSASTFPLQNIHAHQIRFMEEFEAQGGIAFIVLYYTGMDEIYYVPFRTIKHFWDRMEAGGARALPMMKLTIPGGSELTGICWCIIWK